MSINDDKKNSAAMETEYAKLTAEIQTMDGKDAPAMTLRVMMASWATQIELLRRVENNVRI